MSRFEALACKFAKSNADTAHFILDFDGHSCIISMFVRKEYAALRLENTFSLGGIQMTYEMDIAGLKRSLPLCRVTDDLYIGAFVMFGDVELTVHCAAELLKRAPEYDYLIAPEAKAIPLLYEMARQSGAEKYFLARKGAKAYMTGVFEVEVRSITTMHIQKLVIDTADAEMIKGKKVLIVDDVISTGESLHAMEELVKRAGGIIAGKMAVLAEGDAKDRDDIITLAPLPLFNADGTVKA